MSSPREARVAFVEGEAGIRKTALLSEATAIAQARGFRVFAARAEERELDRPFGPIAGAFSCSRTSRDGRRAAIAALLPSAGT